MAEGRGNRIHAGVYLLALAAMGSACLTTGTLTSGPADGQASDAAGSMATDAPGDNSTEAAAHGVDSALDGSGAGEGGDGSGEDAPAEGAVFDAGDATLTDAAALDATVDGTSDGETTSETGANDAPPDGSGSGPDPVCGCPDPATKMCGWTLPANSYGDSNGACVSQRDPAFGCAPSTCHPCTIQNGRAACSGGGCALFACNPGWADCADGGSACATNLRTDSSNCGSCGHACAAGATCTDGVCAVGCAPPLTDCGSGVCPNLLTSNSNCGGCGSSCTATGAADQAQCAGGVCTHTPLPCPPGLTNCSGVCADLSSDPRNCGACGTSCTGNAYGSVAVCSEAACRAPSGVTACAACSGSGFSTVIVDPMRSAAACGGCGMACPTGEACASGACTTLASLAIYTGTVADFAVDSTSLYIVDGTGSGSVLRVPSGGGAATTLASGQAKPVHLAIDDGYVYWSDNLGGAVMRAPKDGSSAASVVAATAQPDTIAVGTTNLYWMASGSVEEAPKDGGSPTQIAGTSRTGWPLLVADNGPAFEILMSQGPILNWVTGAVTPSNSFMWSPSSLVMDLQDVYVAGSFPGAEIVDFPIDAGPGLVGWSTQIEQLELKASPVLDDSFVYFATTQVGCGGDSPPLPVRIQKLPRCRQGAERVFQVIDVDAVNQIRVDGSWVYWSNGSMIGRVAK